MPTKPAATVLRSLKGPQREIENLGVQLSLAILTFTRDRLFPPNQSNPDAVGLAAVAGSIFSGGANCFIELN